MERLGLPIDLNRIFPWVNGKGEPLGSGVGLWGGKGFGSGGITGQGFLENIETLAVGSGQFGNGSFGQDRSGLLVGWGQLRGRLDGGAKSGCRFRHDFFWSPEKKSK